jgi:hypothetical protein
MKVKKKPPGRRVGGRYTWGSAGRAPELPHSPYFKSRFERNYARLLTFNGVRWQYEPKTFYFESVKSGVNRAFKPDFFLPDEGPRGTWHELKGYLDKNSAIKIRRFRRWYPEDTLVVIPYDFFQDCERQGLCRLIPSWECAHFPERLRAEVKTYQTRPSSFAAYHAKRRAATAQETTHGHPAGPPRNARGQFISRRPASPPDPGPPGPARPRRSLHPPPGVAGV